MKELAERFFQAIRDREEAQLVIDHVCQELILAARADDATGQRRRCIVVGEHAVYIDPPGNSATGDWQVSWGTRPEE